MSDMKQTWITATATATLALAGCGGSSLEGDDPKGYEACEKFDHKQDAAGQVDIDTNVVLGNLASQATTEGIRNAAGDGALTPELRASSGSPQLYFVDVVKLRSACAAAGYKF